MHRAIFGDGAGGVRLEATDRGRCFSGGRWTKGEYYDVISMPLETSLHSPRFPPEFRGSFYMGRRLIMFDVLRFHLGA